MIYLLVHYHGERVACTNNTCTVCQTKTEGSNGGNVSYGIRTNTVCSDENAK